MKLFNGEEILSSTNGNIVVLTNYRVRSSNTVGWGAESTTSIMLDKISSIQVTQITYPILLVISCLLLVAAAVISNTTHGSVAIPIIIALVFTSAYFFFRKGVCVISSDGGGKIIFQTSNMSNGILLEFIDKVEEAKHERFIKARPAV